MNTRSAARLSPEELTNKCDPEGFSFKTTDELPELEDVVGQPRAFKALQLGCEIQGNGFNIFVLGLPGSGRLTLTRQYLERKARNQTVPDDWCYVYNFEDPHKPKAIHLPVGKAVELRKDLRELVLLVQKEILNVFNSKEYNSEKEQIASALSKKQEHEFARLQLLAGKYNFQFVKTPFGFVIVPAVEGKPLEPGEIERLSPEKREKLDQLKAKLDAEANKTVQKLRDLEQEAYQKLQTLDAKTALFILEPLISQLVEKYSGLEDVVAHLKALQDDVISNLDTFRLEKEQALTQEDLLKRYDLNILVSNAEQQGSPVVIENQPSYSNLLGRIDQQMVMGITRTNFTLIRPGALHRANGGYLLIPARDLLLSPYAWEGLKRTLREQSIRIIGLETQYGLASTNSLEPEPIPLDVKIVLVGTPLLYYLLQSHDEDFEKLFKVRSEFASKMERTPETEYEYALFVKSVVNRNGLRPFDRPAVARIIEQGSWLVDDQHKLSTRFGKIADLIQEANYWAGTNQHAVVTAEDVDRAIQQSNFRNNLMEERIQESIARGYILIDTESRVAGQVNALSVVLIADNAFGFPSRITASTSPGSAGIIDIEFQAKLGGPIHTKGFLIASGILRERYGRKRPLNLTASVTFEQSYSGVEGDSASAAEIIALLSAIGEVPVRQDVAITGSVNQKGEIQAVGGVNQKIEGFYAVCAQKGLSGSQGVVIPWSNRENLMLDREVIEAVARDEFHIWPVKDLDEAITVLTGLEVGEMNAEGEYAPDTFNHRVAKRLERFSESLKEQLGGNTAPKEE